MDIVERLREYGAKYSHDGPELYGEAAAEIERLFALVAKLQEQRREVQAEVARLREKEMER